MATGHGNGSFSEPAALLLRNEDGKRHEVDMEIDMRRLLMLVRDVRLRDQVIKLQGVRRVTLLSRGTNNVMIQRLCAGILGNLAHSEQGLLSASSCDRWKCVSYRHQCPLAMLLANAYNSGDKELRRLSIVALLAFSTHDDCQRHLEKLESIPILLKLLDTKQEDSVATEVAVYSAAIVWNLCKSPTLLLKLETIYGVFKDLLTRKLTTLLITPLEPLQLFLTPTNERGVPVLLEFDGENNDVLLTASISTQLSVVLGIENRAKSGRLATDRLGSAIIQVPEVSTQKKFYGSSLGQAGTSIAHYDDSGVLASRTCAVCTKVIAVKVIKRGHCTTSLLCLNKECGQMYHLSCSRWSRLSKEVVAEISAKASRTCFYCDACMLKHPLCYWDFLTAHPQHALFFTRNVFEAIDISRVPIAPAPLASRLESTQVPLQSAIMDANQHKLVPHQFAESTARSCVSDVHDKDGLLWPSIMLFDPSLNLVAIGDKTFRIGASKRDPEVYIVMVKHVTIRSYPTTRQERASIGQGEENNKSIATSLSLQWDLSYTSRETLELVMAPGNAVLWPVSYTQEMDHLEYTRHSLAELEDSYMYEFQGQQPHDKTFAVGNKPRCHVALPNCHSIALAGTGVWMALSPRRGICMKVVAAQIGHLRKLQSMQVKKGDQAKARRRRRKLHFPGQQLNKIAVDMCQEREKHR